MRTHWSGQELIIPVDNLRYMKRDTLSPGVLSSHAIYMTVQCGSLAQEPVPSFVSNNFQLRKPSGDVSRLARASMLPPDVEH